MENIVKIVDNNSKFHGTGFLIEVNEKKYCITCHHCIYTLEDIYIEKGKESQTNLQKYRVIWDKALSSMSNDIAVLEVKDEVETEPLKFNKQALKGLPVVLFGYAANELKNIPTGRMIENISLSASITLFHWDAETTNGTREWNQKPEVNVNVFSLQNFFSSGQSGSPVCYEKDCNVVGIFTAKVLDQFGFVIPIQTLLDNFEVNKSDAKQSAKNIELQKSINTLEKVEHAKKFLENHDYENAIGKINEILYQSNYVSAIFSKAQALSQLKKYQEALKWYDVFLVLYPNDIDALNNKGWNLDKLRRFEEAIKQYDLVLAINPKYFNALFNKAFTLDNLNRFKEALELYHKALEIDPNNVNILGNIGFDLDNLGQHKEAIEWYDKALAINPNHTNNISLKALALSKLGKNDVINSANVIMAIDPKDFIALANIGLALGYLGRDGEALEWYDKALAINPDYINCLSDKGIALSNLGRYEEAIDCYDKALATHPNYILALHNKGVAVALLGEYEDAIDLYDKVLAIDPNFAESSVNKKLVEEEIRKRKNSVSN